MNASRPTFDAVRLDDAARAGWLYYVAGNTQDEIARKLGVSRQSAQRLVAMAVSEKLIKVRVDHPIARCMDLAGALSDRFGLIFCEVVPSDPAAPDLLTGIAIAAAAAVSFFCFALTGPLSRILGEVGMSIIVRVLGLILCALAIQFLLLGLSEAIPGMISGSVTAPYPTGGH